MAGVEYRFSVMDASRTDGVETRGRGSVGASAHAPTPRTRAAVSSMGLVLTLAGRRREGGAGYCTQASGIWVRSYRHSFERQNRVQAVMALCAQWAPQPSESAAVFAGPGEANPPELVLSYRMTMTSAPTAFDGSAPRLSRLEGSSPPLLNWESSPPMIPLRSTYIKSARLLTPRPRRAPWRRLSFPARSALRWHRTHDRAAYRNPRCHRSRTSFSTRSSTRYAPQASGAAC